MPGSIFKCLQYVSEGCASKLQYMKVILCSFKDKKVRSKLAQNYVKADKFILLFEKTVIFSNVHVFKVNKNLQLKLSREPPCTFNTSDTSTLNDLYPGMI